MADHNADRWQMNGKATPPLRVTQWLRAKMFWYSPQMGTYTRLGRPAPGQKLTRGQRAARAAKLQAELQTRGRTK